MSTENPAQGSATAIMVAKSSNPAEVVGHLGAEGAADIIPNTSEDPPQSITKQVTKKILNEMGDALDEAAKISGDFIGGRIS